MPMPAHLCCARNTTTPEPTTFFCLSPSLLSCCVLLLFFTTNDTRRARQNQKTKNKKQYWSTGCPAPIILTRLHKKPLYSSRSDAAHTHKYRQYPLPYSYRRYSLTAPPSLLRCAPCLLVSSQRGPLRHDPLRITRAPENGEEEQALKDTNDVVWTKPQLIPRRASLTCFVSVPTWRQAAAPARHAASHASWMPWPLRYACKNPGGIPASVKESRTEEREKTTRTICGIVPSLTCGEEVSGPGGVHDFDLWRRRAVGLAAVHGHATLRAEADDDHGCEPRQHLQVPFPDEGLGLVLVAEEDVDKGPGRRVVSAFGERRRWRWRDRDDFLGGADTHFAFGSPSLGASRAQISSLLLLTSSKLARSTDLVAF